MGDCQFTGFAPGVARPPSGSASVNVPARPEWLLTRAFARRTTKIDTASGWRKAP